MHRLLILRHHLIQANLTGRIMDLRSNWSQRLSANVPGQRGRNETPAPFADLAAELDASIVGSVCSLD